MRLTLMRSIEDNLDKVSFLTASWRIQNNGRVTDIGIPMKKLRQPWECLIFIMSASLLATWHLYIKTEPRFLEFSGLDYPRKQTPLLISNMWSNNLGDNGRYYTIAYIDTHIVTGHRDMQTCLTYRCVQNTLVGMEYVSYAVFKSSVHGNRIKGLGLDT